MDNNINDTMKLDKNTNGGDSSIVNADSPMIKELIDDVSAANIQTDKEDDKSNTRTLEYEERLKKLEEKEQALNRKEWQLKYNLDDTAMSLIKTEEDAQILNKLLKKKIDGFKPDNTRREVVPLTKAEFKRMNYNQRAQIYKTNPELYETLSK